MTILININFGISPDCIIEGLFIEINLIQHYLSKKGGGQEFKLCFNNESGGEWWCQFVCKIIILFWSKVES